MPLVCPPGFEDVRDYSVQTESNIMSMVESLLSEPIMIRECDVYNQFLHTREFMYFHCTKVIDNSTWTPALYRGVLIDTKGHAHYVKIPETMYAQIPDDMKNDIYSKNHDYLCFSIDRKGIVTIK
jgi:hypothetical protein